ncbi:arylsulfatase [Rufibacter tibetensis]|uniref:Sulfatase n=1 Tax=Rufibacter tibetensis TaxID=512763 RepID=A0A0P0C413_9BACT|nr:arylsulfatase [Rufibacter tibetensis]ALI97845.1 sulfatase [Rufibacter tibetensis]
MIKQRFLSLSLVLASGFLLGLAPQKVQPNIIIILADDMGYSDLGSFGSEIQTPQLDALAKGGLKMTQFYNASRCCPTRASLLTGVYPHQAGVGHMVNEREHPSYRGMLNEECVTIAEALKEGGYNTLMTGKWHLNDRKEHWPVKQGFDRYFGLLDGANSYFGNRPYRPNQKLTYGLDDAAYTPGKDFYATNAYTDFALKFIDERKEKAKPFFLYLAYTAPHWPLHALETDIAKYRGKYSKGWDVLREERFKRMKALGILPQTAKLSPRDEEVPAWESVPAAERKIWEEKMAVYAAMVDRMDQNIGRLRQKLKETGEDKNTIIMFLSDNGGSYEDIDGPAFTPEILAASKMPASDPASFTAYEYEGANLSNTPFRKFKRWEHEGGISTPFIAYFPNTIKPGSINHQPAHIIDLMATTLDLAGVAYPKTYQGKTIKPMEGISLAPLFKGQKWQGHDAIFFEHEGNRAVRQGDWKLVSMFPENKWALYNIKTDRSELNDLSAQNPKKVQEMEALYNAWATRANVVPFAQLLEYDKQKKSK